MSASPPYLRPGRRANGFLNRSSKHSRIGFLIGAPLASSRRDSRRVQPLLAPVGAIFASDRRAKPEISPGPRPPRGNALIVAGRGSSLDLNAASFFRPGKLRGDVREPLFPRLRSPSLMSSRPLSTSFRFLPFRPRSAKRKTQAPFSSPRYFCPIYSGCAREDRARDRVLVTFCRHSFLPRGPIEIFSIISDATVPRGKRRGAYSKRIEILGDLFVLRDATRYSIPGQAITITVFSRIDPADWNARGNTGPGSFERTDEGGRS